MNLVDAIIQVKLSPATAGRAAARKLIETGKIYVDGLLIDSCSFELSPGKHQLHRSGRRPETQEIEISQ